MSDTDESGGGGFSAGLIVAMIVIGGVLVLFIAGFASFRIGGSSYSVSMPVSYPVASSQETGSGAWGSYTLTRSSDGVVRSWALVRLDPDGKLIAAVFGYDVDVPAEAEADWSSFKFAVDLTTDVTIHADGSKPLQVITPKGVREFKPAITGAALDTALKSIDTSSVMSTLQQVGGQIDVEAAAPQP